MRTVTRNRATEETRAYTASRATIIVIMQAMQAA